MIGFLGISKIRLPYSAVFKAYEHMRKAGKEYLEGVALFAGKEEGEEFLVTETIIPKQIATSLEDGLLYSVDADELYRINMYLYENGLSLIAQIHSHPRKAFHSDTDDVFPIVTTGGAVSIVVPDFANQDISIESWAVFRITEKGGWHELIEAEKNSLLLITN